MKTMMPRQHPTIRPKRLVSREWMKLCPGRLSNSVNRFGCMSRVRTSVQRVVDVSIISICKLSIIISWSTVSYCKWFLCNEPFALALLLCPCCCCWWYVTQLLRPITQIKYLVSDDNLINFAELADRFIILLLTCNQGWDGMWINELAGDVLYNKWTMINYSPHRHCPVHDKWHGIHADRKTLDSAMTPQRNTAVYPVWPISGSMGYHRIPVARAWRKPFPANYSVARISDNFHYLKSISDDLVTIPTTLGFHTNSAVDYLQTSRRKGGKKPEKFH